MENKPLGKLTRGKTTRNRLRRVDLFIARYDPGLLRQADPQNKRNIYLDLGFGFEPITTLESAARFSKLNPQLYTIGVEIDPERVEEARPFSTPNIDFRHGGFNLPLKANESARLIRAFNVLRQYDRQEVAFAYQTLTAYLIEGGLLMEGTSDPFGRVWTANLIRKQNQQQTSYEAITFSTNFRHGFEPANFQPVLPKNLIHLMKNNNRIETFFKDWKAATLETIGYKQFGLRQWFIESVYLLSQQGYQLDLRKKMLKSGFLTWKKPGLNY
ncbi:MAG: hypothetical protein JW757_02785 [Anaerolineales bacterium]|nr:hypothetical protein [Anaerolineales bacterium]